ncbi:MAG TPA: hypothetical protein DEP36_10680 [Gammaproteobacteria bacterium]|nr:hypothetical protein [Gammaproteobacteria bacterium]
MLNPGGEEQGLSIAGICRKTPIAPNRANHDISIFFAATSHIHRILRSLNADDVGALHSRLNDLLRKNLSGNIRAAHFKLRSLDGGLNNQTLLVIKNLGLADTARHSKRYDY